MKSKLKFDLGENNREIISATIVKTNEDVRDRIASGFLQGLGYGTVCQVRIYQPNLNEAMMDIYPVDLKNIDVFAHNLPSEFKRQLFIELSKYFENGELIERPDLKLDNAS